MLFIAHRGNISGPNPAKENHPSYIKETRAKGFLVEVDVWWTDRWVLGHDGPQYEITEDFFKEMGMTAIYHAKNSEALERLSARRELHSFWHQDDDYTMTSNGYPWVFPGKRLFAGAICVMPELGFNGVLFECAGVCSDHIATYRKNLCV